MTIYRIAPSIRSCRVTCRPHVQHTLQRRGTVVEGFEMGRVGDAARIPLPIKATHVADLHEAQG